MLVVVVAGQQSPDVGQQSAQLRYAHSVVISSPSSAPAVGGYEQPPKHSGFSGLHPRVITSQVLLVAFHLQTHSHAGVVVVDVVLVLVVVVVDVVLVLVVVVVVLLGVQ